MTGRDAIGILGVPIDNLTLNEAVPSIFSAFQDYEADNIPRYISTVNIDFLVNSHHWNKTVPICPELMRVLRLSSIAVPDGMPIVWLSRLLGNSLKMRIPGVDLFSAICKECVNQNRSIFFLGGAEETIQKAVKIIQEENPGIKIAGIACPAVFIEGKNLASTHAQDLAVLEQIHAASPDFLILSLGNPKQEIWFARVLHILHVPITLGLGGGLNFIAGEVSRAPLWMQNNGLEWIYRFYQEPQRLWKRYLIDMFKFSYLSIPLLAVHYIKRLFSALSTTVQDKYLHQFQTSSQISILAFPSQVTEKHLRGIRSMMLDAYESQVIVFDFQAVKFIDLKGINLLIEFFLSAQEYQKKCHAINISYSLRWLLKLHKIWDLISPTLSYYQDDLLQSLTEKERQPCVSIDLTDAFLYVNVLGLVSDNMEFQHDERELAALLRGRDCIVDLRYCSGIENAGIAFLLQINNIQKNQGKELTIASSSTTVRGQLKLAKAYSLFKFGDVLG